MTDRITDKHLEALCKRINELRGTPLVAYAKVEDDKYRACVGNYHLDHAYGGVNLVQMVNESGGVRNVFGYGHGTKRELYDMMQAYIQGLTDAKQAI